MRFRKPTPEEEAKAIVLLAFRNGPIEDAHAGHDRCRGCRRSGITDAQMKQINKVAVDRVWMLLRLRELHPQFYRSCIACGSASTSDWDPPEVDREWAIACATWGRMMSGKGLEPARPKSRAKGNPRKRRGNGAQTGTRCADPPA